MSMNSIPLFFDENSIMKRINMTSVKYKIQLTMHRAARDIQSSIQKCENLVDRN